MAHDARASDGRLTMKIVVIGGTGLIGSKFVQTLTEHGHEAVPASPALADVPSALPLLALPFREADASDQRGDDRSAVRLAGRARPARLVALPCRQLGGGRQALRRAVRRGPRTPLGKRLIPCDDRRGEADQWLLDPPTRSSMRRSSSSLSRGPPRPPPDGDTARLAPVLSRPIAADDVASAVARTAIGAR